MRTLILAAGSGRRMGDLTRDRPKALLEVGDRTILDYIVQACEVVDVEEVVLVVGYKEEALRDHIGTAQEWSFDVAYVRNPRSKVTENAYSVYLARERVEGDSFLLVNADTLFHPEIAEDVTRSGDEKAVLAVDTEKKLGREEMKVVIEDGCVVRISKELEPSEADGEYIGVAHVRDSAGFYNSLREALRQQGPRIYYEEAFAQMACAGRPAMASSIQGRPWIEVDTPEDLSWARRSVGPQIQTHIEGSG